MSKSENDNEFNFSNTFYQDKIKEQWNQFPPKSLFFVISFGLTMIIFGFLSLIPLSTIYHKVFLSTLILLSLGCLVSLLFLAYQKRTITYDPRTDTLTRKYEELNSIIILINRLGNKELSNSLIKCLFIFSLYESLTYNPLGNRDNQKLLINTVNSFHSVIEQASNDIQFGKKLNTLINKNNYLINRTIINSTNETYSKESINFCNVDDKNEFFKMISEMSKLMEM